MGFFLVFLNMLGSSSGLEKDSRENVTQINWFSCVCCFLSPIRLQAPWEQGPSFMLFVLNIPTWASSLLFGWHLGQCLSLLHLTDCVVSTYCTLSSALSPGNLVDMRCWDCFPLSLEVDLAWWEWGWGDPCHKVVKVRCVKANFSLRRILSF